MCLVSAMHITAGIWVNDGESGLKHDVMVWLEQLAPAGDYRHHQTGEDNADAHLKRARSSTTRSCCPSRRACSTWARGSRSSTPSSTGAERSASS